MCTTKDKKYKQAVPGILLVTACSFLLFIYAPLELYFMNKYEFWYDLYDLIPVVLLLFFTAALIGSVLVVLLRYLNEKVYYVGVAVCFTTYIASYIQGNFLVKKLPPLDGTDINWSDYSAEHIKTIVVWVIVTLAVLALIHFFKMEKFAAIAQTVAVCMTLMLAVTLVTICIKEKGTERKIEMSITDDALYEMSTDKNLIVLVVDAVDSATFANVMENHPEYRENFADFTYYPDTVGAYPYTVFSIPYILSGEWFEHEEPFEEYSKWVYRESPLFAELEEEGYKIGIYESEIKAADEAVYRFENIKEGSGKICDYWEFIKVQIRLVGTKYAPFSLKRYCFFDTSWVNEMQLPAGENLYSANNRAFYASMNSKPVVPVADKCFKFIHTEGAHSPMRYDADLNYSEHPSYEGNVEAAMTTVETYINKLKQAGVYDNTALVVMADHGYCVDGSANDRQNPFFMVKGIGEKHEFQTSNAPLSYEELQEIFRRLRNGADSTEAVDAAEGDERERRYIYYKFLGEKKLEEQYTKGHASDQDALVPSGEVYTK